MMVRPGRPRRFERRPGGNRSVLRRRLVVGVAYDRGGPVAWRIDELVHQMVGRDPAKGVRRVFVGPGDSTESVIRVSFGI